MAGANDMAASVSPLEFVEDSSVRAVESMKKEDTNLRPSSIARSTGICHFFLKRVRKCVQ
jgi:hypothetical protein